MGVDRVVPGPWGDGMVLRTDAPASAPHRLTTHEQGPWVQAIHTRLRARRPLESMALLAGVHEMSMMEHDTQGGQVP